jgi:two-component system, response regulator PdtaR
MNHKKILIVEDEALIALDLQNRLRRQGYQVLPVTDSAAKAVESADKNRPDIILVDVILKGEKTGIDAAFEIIQNRAVPILFLTGNTHLINDERLDKIPNHLVLGKPPVESAILRAIKKLLQDG